jgi:hypothetical protein
MRILRPAFRSILLAAAVLAAACNVTDADFRDRPLPAIIDPGSPAAPQVVVPREVRAGEVFTVRVTTFGGGCVNKGYTESAADDRGVDVRPYDFFPNDENAPCTRALRAHLHEAAVRMETPGPGVVRIHGRRMSDGEPVTVTRDVTITQ